MNHRQLFAPALVALLGAGACNPELSASIDDRPLADALNLLHIHDVLDDPDLTLGEFVERASELTFTAAPDPTLLLENINQLDDDRPSTGGTSLRLLTQNIGLLEGRLWGVAAVPGFVTPLLEERREAVLGRVLDDEPDVVFLQEVWLPEDWARFTEQAEDAGYFVSLGSRDGYNDGLMLLIRESLLDGATVEEGTFDYNWQEWWEWWGAGIARGYQWVRVDHPDLGELFFVNTHMAPYVERWHDRLREARQVAIAVEEMAGEDALVFLGGDLNAGPYYRDDVWAAPEDQELPDWWANTTMWPTLMEYGDFTDLAIMGRAAADATADVVLGDTVVNDAATSTTVPGAEEGWCEDTPAVTFTASDCNSLYFEQYAGTEYPARLDHVMVRDRDARVRAVDSFLANVEPEEFGDVTTEPSDHYGVIIDIVIDGT